MKNERERALLTYGCAALLASVAALYAETPTSRLFIPFFDKESQTNIQVLVSDLDHGEPTLPAYTNVLTNTNLISQVERLQLERALHKYQFMTTNSGPPGTVLTDLCVTNLVDLGRTNKTWVSEFSYTNSHSREKVTWLRDGITAKYVPESGCGYVLGILTRGSETNIRFDQLRDNRKNGLRVELTNDRLHTYMRYTNGLAIGKFLMWNPLTSRLLIDAEFRQPYSIEEHRYRVPER